MNILIIGNGFDLAHGLQTSYKDFLTFTKEFANYKTITEKGNVIDRQNLKEPKYIEYLSKLFNESKDDNGVKKIIDELDEMIKDNIWLKHFDKVQKNNVQTCFEVKRAKVKDGWIDFESEISRVIQEFEEVLKINNNIFREDKGNNSWYELLNMRQAEMFERLGIKLDNNIEEDVSEKKEKGLKDLDKLIRCLEIYLSDYINKVRVEKTLLDIKELLPIDKVLSFNYTNTFERLYKNSSLVEFDYIHGQADIEKGINTNNMVLGIDEYLKGEERNENIEFIAFKKFYQRIHKETGCLYKIWVAEIRADDDALNKGDVKQHNLFIFGHSLDITDRDVLRDLILNDNVQTVIFYKDKEDFGRKIANLVRVLGQDELIKRTGGTTKTITFKLIAKGK